MRTPGGREFCVVVARHPQEFRVRLLDLLDRDRIGPAELDSGEKVVLEADHPEDALGCRDREQDAERHQRETRTERHQKSV
jgi:hypothetical protein